MEFNVHFIPVACQEPESTFFAGIEISEDLIGENTTVQQLHTGIHGQFKHGTRVPYGCQSGYQYDDSVTNIPYLECMNGVWSGDNKCTGTHVLRKAVVGCMYL